MKKLVSLLLVLSCVLALFLSVPVLAAGFTDVDDSKYYADAIKWAVENNITNGIGNNQFGVNNTVTRGQAVTFLWRAMGNPSPNETASRFDDVEQNSWYERAVQWAVENKITDGVGNNKFDPDGPVTRGQLITFLYRAKGQPGDRKDGDKWYSAAERWANQKGLLNGTAEAYDTDAKCPRCDVVYYLWKEVQGPNTSNTSNTSQQQINPTKSTETNSPTTIDPNGYIYDGWGFGTVEELKQNKHLRNFE